MRYQHRELEGMSLRSSMTGIYVTNRISSVERFCKSLRNGERGWNRTTNLLIKSQNDAQFRRLAFFAADYHWRHKSGRSKVFSCFADDHRLPSFSL